MLYYRWYDDKWGRGHRTMARMTSKDLMIWTPSVPMTYGDTPREQFYVNNTQPYFFVPHLYATPAARFMEGRQVLDEKRAAAIGLLPIGKHVYFKNCSGGVLVTIGAGSTVYDRTFLETFVRPGPSDANWGSRRSAERHDPLFLKPESVSYGRHCASPGLYSGTKRRTRPSREKDVAKRFELTSGLISQMRREFYQSWQQFHEECG